MQAPHYITDIAMRYLYIFHFSGPAKSPIISNWPFIHGHDAQLIKVYCSGSSTTNTDWYK